MFRAIAKSCGALVTAFCKKLPDLLRDVAGLIAVASISYGAWLVYEPAGYIVAGVLILVGVIMNSFGKTRATGG